MNAAFISWRLSPDLWLACAAMALYASYVALGLARGGASKNRSTAWRSITGTALAMGAGIWAAYFVAVASDALPFALAYNPRSVVSALAAALALCLACATVSSHLRPSRVHTGIAAAALGTAACVVPVLALHGLELNPPIVWSPAYLLLGWLCACACAAGALAVVMVRRNAGLELGFGRQMLVAAGLCACIVLGDASALKAASVPALAVLMPHSPASHIAANTLSGLAFIGVPALLSLLLTLSVLEAQFRVRLRRMRDEVRRVAQTDRLTELPNRAMFEEELQGAVVRAYHHQHRLALLFLNLDGLKAVNESFGQSTGDIVLREMATRLRNAVGARDLVARAGGDEFLLLIEGNPDVEDASRVAKRVLSGLNAMCHIEEHEISMSCSIGVVMYPAHGEVGKLIARAAAAMHVAKRNGGARHCFFEETMLAGRREQVELLLDLRRALENKELELYYQPKIHAPSGQITGAEALMRWNHPQRGLVGPHIFIPLAERFGLINALGNWLIDDVCRQIQMWREEGLRMRVSINLSAHQLRQEDLIDRISAALARNHVDPSLLTCELTESAAMDDTRITLQVIERLAAVGVHLSIDDFGTGYSSLSYLRQLAAEELKIDGSFVHDLATSADARAIVDAVVKLAQALGLKVVAEGVETEEQQEILRQFGCNELQGFLFAKPMPAHALQLWATQDQGPRALDFRASLFGDTLPHIVS